MNKREIIAYFDARAPEWDARMVRSDSKIAFILDAAGVRPGVSVLDVACGTGVLFGDYLARDAARVTGVDISPEMARIAVSKLRDPRVEVLCGDVEELALPRRYDCCALVNKNWTLKLYFFAYNPQLLYGCICFPVLFGRQISQCVCWPFLVEKFYICLHLFWNVFALQMKICKQF